jgi:transposase, IS5 family
MSPRHTISKKCILYFSDHAFTVDDGVSRNMIYRNVEGLPMKILTPCRETFQSMLEQPGWHRDPELALFDTIIRLHPEVLDPVTPDVLALGKNSQWGRQDSPSVEQVVRAAIYKEVKGLSYEQLEYHQYDSKIAAVFLQVCRPFTDSTWQKYIGAISQAALTHVLHRINQIALDEGLEDLQKIRPDTTVVETHIHYPTNNSLLWDGIRLSIRILRQFDVKWVRHHTRDYRRQAKKLYFRLNCTRDSVTRKTLFTTQLQIVGRCIAQLRAMLLYLRDQTRSLTPADTRRVAYLTELLPHLETIRDVARRREILQEDVPATEKLFSLFERHTRMIIKGKGQRKVKFGRKVSLTSGRSGLIVHCHICDDETDGQTFEPLLRDILATYQRVPRDVATDGAYASGDNQRIAAELGLTNVVFTKLKGALHNLVSSPQMETRLKKWRSGAEAVISNLKRGFHLRRCLWKGEVHFQAKVLWSVLAYNLRVMSRIMLQKLVNLCPSR